MRGEIFLFCYFKGHGDGLHLAWSADGYGWHSLREDRVLIDGRVGNEKIMRDPSMVLGRDGTFHLVWTAGWNEKGIGYAFSKDLEHWSEQQFLPVMEHEVRARNCWAPEIFFNAQTNEYMVYWSSTVDGQFPETQPYGDDGYNHRLYFVTTPDFKKFSETKLLYDPGFNVIDGTIVRSQHEFLLFMKNETLVPAQKNLRMAIGHSPFQFGPAGEALTPNHYWAEGPTAIQVGGYWLVYFDKYKINEMGAIRSRDLKSWEDISHLVNFPPSAQHGFVTTVPFNVLQTCFPDTSFVARTAGSVLL